MLSSPYYSPMQWIYINGTEIKVFCMIYSICIPVYQLDIYFQNSFNLLISCNSDCFLENFQHQITYSNLQYTTEFSLKQYLTSFAVGLFLLNGYGVSAICVIGPAVLQALGESFSDSIVTC